MRMCKMRQVQGLVLISFKNLQIKRGKRRNKLMLGVVNLARIQTYTRKTRATHKCNTKVVYGVKRWQI